MLTQLVGHYLAQRRLTVARLASWRVLRSQLACFLEFLDTVDVDAPAELTPELLAGFQAALFARITRFGKPPSARYQACVLGTVRSFLAYLVREGYLLANPAAALELPHVPKRLPPGGLTRAEAERLVSAPDPATPLGARDRAMLETLYATGIRASELVGLKLSDLGGDSETPILRVVNGKGGKDRVVPLGQPAWHACRHYLETARPHLPRATASRLLFLSRRGKPLCDDDLNALIARYCQSAAIERHVTAHTLRHTCACLMLKAGCDIRYIQALLGHASLATTQLYTKVDISDLARAHARFHPHSFPRGKPRPHRDCNANNRPSRASSRPRARRRRRDRD